MKIVVFLAAIILFCSCNTSYFVATFTNKNVYKTKSALTVKKIYHGDRPATDQREFTLLPNEPVPVTKTTTTVVTAPHADNPTNKSTITTTTTTTTIPPDSKTEVSSTAEGGRVTGKITTTSTAFSMPAKQATNNFIRYTVLSDEGDFKYIRVLPGCVFVGSPPFDTSIVISENNFTEEKVKKNEPVNNRKEAKFTDAQKANNLINTSEVPEEFIFQVSKKALMPNTHYLASSALIGKVITIPLRIRKEYWAGNTVLQGTLALGYGFGWKYKLFNNPYKPHYVTTILYAAGISQQKHLALRENTLVP